MPKKETKDTTCMLMLPETIMRVVVVGGGSRGMKCVTPLEEKKNFKAVKQKPKIDSGLSFF